MSNHPPREPEVEVRFKVGDETVKLDPEAVRYAVRNSRRRGNCAGAMTGTTMGFGVWRYFRFSRNKALLTGVMTYIFSSYAYATLDFAYRMREMVEERRKALSSELIPDEFLQDPAGQWKSS